MAEKKESGGRKTQSAPKIDINQWILTRVKTCFKHVKNDKFKKAFAQETTKVAIDEFINGKDSQSLFFVGDSLQAMLELQVSLPPKQKAVYFLKT